MFKAASHCALLLTLLLSGYSATCQTTSQVCLATRQAAKIADSLAVLPLVRRESASWQQAAGQYKLAADSLGKATATYQHALRAQQQIHADQSLLLANEQATTALWKQRARRRGLLNYLGLALIGGAGYLFLTH